MEKFRKIARDLHYDVCERYFTEDPETDDQIIRDAQTLAQEVLLSLDENARDALVKNFATNASPKDAPEGSTSSDAT